MNTLKKVIKINSHNAFFKVLAGLGRSINRFYENRNHNSTSNGEITVLKKLAKFNPRIIIDGGGNVGEYSHLIRSVIDDCKIYCFEPVEETFKTLTANLKDENNIFTINKGLYSTNCLKDINVFTSNEHSSIYSIQGISEKPINQIEIELVTGDLFLEQHQIDTVDLLKLDLEGAEYEALKGFEEALRSNKIKVIQFEYGYINITTKKLLIDFYNLLESHDYIIGKVFPKKVEFRKYHFKYEDFLGPQLYRC